jgi:hypothetical protein
MSASDPKKAGKAAPPPTPSEGGPPETPAPTASTPAAAPSPTGAPVAAPPNDDYTAKARSFDRFRLSQNFDRVAGVAKVIVTVNAQKPNGQAWFRVHQDEGYRMQVALLKLKNENEVFLISPSLVEQLAAEVVPHILYTYITRQGVVGLWPARLPSGDGRTDHWMRSAHEAAHIATTRWVRMTANMAAGAYDVNVTSANLSEPEWPEITFIKLLELAFAEHIVEDINHPVLRRLRGEI